MISVISLISYDAHLLPSSIASYYDYVDEIILGIDSDLITWSGNKFTFNKLLLRNELEKIDKDNKIIIINDNFHKFNVAITNDTYERNLLKSYCKGDIIISIDADEILLNAKDFFYKFLPIAKEYKNHDILFRWILPYKKIDDTYLVIANEDNSPFMGDVQGFCTTNNSVYTYCRWTNNTKHILSNLCILHYSFCRNENEVDTKINNFGHSDRTAEDPFFDTWKKVNLDNYQQLRNFKTSGFGENNWNKLVAVKEDQLLEWLNNYVKRVY